MRLLIIFILAPVSWGQVYVINDTGTTGGDVYGYALPHGTLPVAPSTTWAISGSSAGISQAAYDPSSGSVYTVNSNAGTILKFTSGGVESTFLSVSNISGIAVDASGNVYVGSMFGAEVDKYTSSGSGPIVFSMGPAGGFEIDSMTFDGSGNLFIADDSGNIYKLTSSAVLSTFASGIFNESFLGITIDNSGNVYISFQNGTTAGGVYAFNSCGVLTSTLLTYATCGSLPCGLPIGMAFDPMASQLFVALSEGGESNTGAVYESSLLGVQNKFASNALNFPSITGPAATGTPVCSGSTPPFVFLTPNDDPEWM